MFLSVEALEDQVTEITPAALSFINPGTPSEKLVYNITKPLLPGQGETHKVVFLHIFGFGTDFSLIFSNCIYAKHLLLPQPLPAHS